MRRSTGLTVIELVISGVILVVILTIVGDFLISSLNLTDETEARNEMQVNIRSAMEMVHQDVFSAGSEGVLTPCAVNYNDASEPGYEKPLEVTDKTAQDFILTVRYCDPYENPAAANTITYEINSDTANNNLPTLFRTVNGGNAVPAVPGIIGFELDFYCAPTAALCDPTDAAFDPETVLSVTIKLAAQSTWKTRRVNQTCKFSLDGSTTCSSAPGYYYEYAEQSVSPPNLRY